MNKITRVLQDPHPLRPMESVISDLRAYIAELESRTAAPVVAEGWQAGEPPQDAQFLAYHPSLVHEDFNPLGVVEACFNGEEFIGAVWNGVHDCWDTLPIEIEKWKFIDNPLAAHPVAGSPADPMDWKLPCDVKVGHGTIGKGCKLRTLVARMNVLYNMAHEKAEPMPASEAADALLLQRMEATVSDLKREVEYHKAQVHAAHRDLDMRRQKEVGEVWYWQHEGGNNVESLTCPIVIPAQVFRDLLAAAPVPASEAATQFKACPMSDCGSTLVGTGMLPCGVATVSCGHCGVSVPGPDGDYAKAIARWNNLAAPAAPTDAKPDGSLIDEGTKIAAQSVRDAAQPTIAAEDVRDALAKFAAYPLEDFSLQGKPDDYSLFAANDWRMTVGDIRKARAAIAATTTPKD